MNRMAFFAMIPLAALACAHRPAPEPTPEPAKPRAWSFTVDDWHPITAEAWGRMSEYDKAQAVTDDRRVIEYTVILPDDAKPKTVNLTIKLGKGQHRGGDYWPATLDALEASGWRCKAGRVTYKRGESKDDIATTIELKEGQ